MDGTNHQIMIGQGRRVVLPLELCEQLQLDVGDKLAVRLENDVIQLESADKLLERFRAKLKERVGDRSLVDELIAERRANAARE